MTRSPSRISPRGSSHAVNDAVNAITQKLNAANVHIKPDATSSSRPSSNPNSRPASRRASFSMENILHPGKKEKKQDDSKEKESKKDKRISMPGSKASKSKDKHNATSPRTGPVRPAKLELFVESPPLVFYGSANSSTGALFSGRLRLIVGDPSGSVTLNDFTMILRATVHTKKPVSKECIQCMDKHDELKKWTFITQPTAYPKDKDIQFPFSYLFPGNLPATTLGHLGSLQYSLLAQANTSTGEIIELVHPLKILRAIPCGPDPKSSIRIFPPTNLTGRVQLPPVVYPIGVFPVRMTLSGVVEKRAESQTRWRLRKMMWRIEEQCRVVSSPCAKHASKVSEGKAIQHDDTRTLANEDLKSGWKTDFDTAGGEISLEFEATVVSRPNTKAACDMDSKSGLEIKHVLIIELIVAEEFCPNKNTQLITPTGAARVLRMQFNLVVTERAGMGISWDEEQPPMYEDVPPSPPGYGGNKIDEEFGTNFASIEDYSGPIIVPHDLERLPTNNADGLPYYREVDPGLSYINQGLPMRNGSVNSDSLHSGSLHSNDSVVVESSTRTRLGGLRVEDLEAETEEEAYRRRRLEELEAAAAATRQEDFGEGLAGQAPVAPSRRA